MLGAPFVLLHEPPSAATGAYRSSTPPLFFLPRTACGSSLARGGSLTQRARDGGLSRGCTAQLVFVPFLMDILEVVSAPQIPSSSGTGVAAHSVLKSGSNRLSAGEVRQFWRVLVETAPRSRFTGTACGQNCGSAAGRSHYTAWQRRPPPQGMAPAQD